MIDRIMMERAQTPIIVADSSKLGRESFSRISALTAQTILITDQNANPDITAQIRADGVDVRII